MTTRKAARDGRPARPRTRGAILPALAAISLLALAGCATPGPLHVYSLSGDAAPQILDHRAAPGDAPRAEVPSHLAETDTVTGFAYDPFTDHFFLRLAPGNRIRVVDRPARAIKREFELTSLPATGGGDLAVRPRDGHLFLLHPDTPAITETTRLGKTLRTFTLAGFSGRDTPLGLALDPAGDRLFALHASARDISIHTLDGRQSHRFTLDRAVAPSLAFDAERAELYAPLADANAIGVFNLEGQLLRQLDRPPARFIDVGPRSFVRVF